MGWLSRRRTPAKAREEAHTTTRPGLPPTTKGGADSHPYADDALKNLHGDELSRRRLAERMSRILTNVSGQSESAVVALVGPWGSGKSTLLDAIECELEAMGSWQIAHYNPWSYSSLDHAVIGFFSELSSALPQDALQKERRQVIGDWASKIAPLGAVGSLVGRDASGSLRAIANLITGDQSPEKLRARAAKQLETLKRPILMILDDLDRLEPAELLLTFKLIRLLGRLPNVFYLLAYDEETLEGVLSRTDLVGSGSGRGRDYLEKMVQVRLDIPPLLVQDRGTMIDNGLNRLLQRHGIELDEDATSRLQSAWQECLSYYLSQPRAIKKLLSQVDALWPEVAGEVDFADFFMITFIRTFERSVFDLIVSSRTELVRVHSSMYVQKESHQDAWARWIKAITDAGARDPLKLATLMTEMFLPLRSAKENMTYAGSWMDRVDRRRGIGSSDFFDRYTQLGVPPHDISDAQLKQAVIELVSGRPGVALDDLEKRMETDAVLVGRRLLQYDDINKLPEAQALKFLGRHYEAAMTQKSGIFGFSPDFGLLGLARALLARMDASSAMGVLKELAQTQSGLALAGDLAHRALQADAAEEAPAWVEPGVPFIGEQVEAHVRRAARTPLDQASRTTFRMLWALRQIRGQERVRELVWELIEDEGPWTLEDFLAFLIPLGTSSDGRRTWDSLGELSAGDIDGMLGLDRVLSHDIAMPVQASVDLGRLEDEESTDFAARRRNAAATIAELKVRFEHSQSAADQAEQQLDQDD